MSIERKDDREIGEVDRTIGLTNTNGTISLKVFDFWYGSRATLYFKRCIFFAD